VKLFRLVFVRSLTEFMKQRTKSAVEAHGLWTSHYEYLHTLFVYIKHVKMEKKSAALGLFHCFWRHTNICEKTVNTTERLQFINTNILFDKFIKSVIRLLDESSYFCVNFRLCVVNILTKSIKMRVRAESIHHFDYAAKYRLKKSKIRCSLPLFLLLLRGTHFGKTFKNTHI
jgi:hypothetical protein